MYSLSILLIAHFANGLLSGGSSEIADNTGNVMSTWAEYAYKWFMKQNCNETSNVIEETCAIMQSVEKFNYRVYGTEPVANKRIGAVFPDGEVKHKVFHDGIVILDPFPVARFGHPILVFHVDITSMKSDCDDMKGFLVENQYCLQPLSRTHCNRLGYRSGHRMKSFYSVSGPNCGEVVFLPLVHIQTELAIQSKDRLRCFSNIDGFHRSCPQLRSKSETSRVSCDPFLTNRNCGFFENRLDSRCAASQTCDHAVLLSGGWNRQLSDVSTFDNIMNVKRLLMVHGFSESNIEMFYANGPEDKSFNKDDSIGKNDSNQDDSDSDEEEVQSYYSSSLKVTMRNHIRTVCDSEYCADTLLIYMNSPAKPDGSSLLWDIFDNGMYNDEELYSPKEMLRDISRCKANRVVILADQSYGGALVSAAEARFINLQNVIIFTSAEEFNHSAQKDQLTAQLLREKYYDICLNDFRNIISKTIKSSEFIGYKPNLLNSTLVGGPCTGKAISLNDPSMEKYRGCSLAPVV